MRWMSLADAIARAGSFAALLPHLASGGISARANRCTVTETGGTWRRKDDAIRRHWWEPNSAPRHIEGSRCRIKRFITDDLADDIDAHDIEVDADAIDRLFPPPAALPVPVVAPPPAAPTSAQRTAVALASKKAAHLSGFWKKIAPAMDAKVDRDGPFPYLGGACKFVLSLGLGNLDPKALRIGIKRHFPHWFVEDEKVPR
jgi:hypothetical protein